MSKAGASKGESRRSRAASWIIPMFRRVPGEDIGRVRPGRRHVGRHKVGPFRIAGLFRIVGEVR